MSIVSEEELKIITKDYISLTNEQEVTLRFKGVSEKKALVFSVYQRGSYLKDYELTKRNLSPYSQHPYLSVPEKDSANLMSNNKAHIVNWVNKKTNLNMSEKDISLIVTRGKRITVCINPNSARFYNDFTINIT